MHPILAALVLLATLVTWSPAVTIAAAQQPLDLSQDRTLREAVADVRRLGLVTDVRESQPGTLQLTVGPAFSGSTSTRYNLNRLYLAYAAHQRGFTGPIVLQLLDGGTVIGQYTTDGLRSTREPAGAPTAAANGPNADTTKSRRAVHHWYAAVGAGGGGADFTCNRCTFERSSALSGYVMVGRQVGSRAVLGIEATGWTKSDDTSQGRIYTVTAVALGYFDDDLPLFISGGIGYAGYWRDLPGGAIGADAAGYSLRLGAEFRLSGSLRFGPYVGFVGSFGRPAFMYAGGTPFGLSAGYNNLQVGAALILR